MFRAWSAETTALPAAIARNAARRGAFHLSSTRLAPSGRRKAKTRQIRVVSKASVRRADAAAATRARAPAINSRNAAASGTEALPARRPGHGLRQREKPNAATAATATKRRVARRLGASNGASAPESTKRPAAAIES